MAGNLYDMKYRREDHDQRQANGGKWHEFGLTPVISGKIRPAPPKNSQTPMKTNRPCGTAENHATG